ESWAELAIEQNHEEAIGLVGRAIRIPRVILLTEYDRLPRRRVRFSRHNIYLRDRNNCQYCNTPFPKCELNLDHVIPRSQGGRTSRRRRKRRLRLATRTPTPPYRSPFRRREPRGARSGRSAAARAGSGRA